MTSTTDFSLPMAFVSSCGTQRATDATHGAASHHARDIQEDLAIAVAIVLFEVRNRSFDRVRAKAHRPEDSAAQAQVPEARPFVPLDLATLMSQQPKGEFIPSPMTRS